jgi:hypothetical protein
VMLAKLLYWGVQLQEARAEYEKTRALALAAGHRFVAEDCDLALQKLEPTVPDPSSRQAPRSAS